MVDCKLCSSKRSILLKKIKSRYKMNGNFVKSRFDIVRCLNCNLVRVEPVLGQDVLTGNYDKEYYETYSRNADYKKEHFEPLLGELELYARKGKVLDVGCGDGFFLYLAKEKGWESYGVETSRAALDFAKTKYRVDIFHGPLEELNLKEDSFNLVTLWDALEHVNDPSSSLGAIKKLLTREGILVIETPNYHNIWHKYRFLENTLLGVDSLNIPGHAHLFNPHTLRTMLSKMGFNIIEFKFINYGIVRHTKLWPNARLIKRLYFRCRNVIRVCCNFLSALSKTGDHMRVICKKG